MYAIPGVLQEIMFLTVGVRLWSSGCDETVAMRTPMLINGCDRTYVDSGRSDINWGDARVINDNCSIMQVCKANDRRPLWCTAEDYV